MGKLVENDLHKYGDQFDRQNKQDSYLFRMKKMGDTIEKLLTEN